MDTKNNYISNSTWLAKTDLDEWVNNNKNNNNEKNIDESFFSKADKEKLINDLKSSAWQVPLFFRWVYNKMVDKIEKKYDSLPLSKKQKLDKINNLLKTTKNKSASFMKSIISAFKDLFKKESSE